MSCGAWAGATRTNPPGFAVSHAALAGGVARLRRPAASGSRACRRRALNSLLRACLSLRHRSRSFFALFMQTHARGSRLPAPLGSYRSNVLTSEVLGLKTIILGLAAVQAMASRRIVRFAVGFCGPSSA